MDLGDFKYGAVVYVPLNTYNADGASVTLTGLAVTDIEIYKNGSVTQRASDAGYVLLDTDGIDFDSITGIHGFSIDTADNSTAGFFGPGNDYWSVVSAVTVNAQTVNFVRTFSIENRMAAGLLVRTTIATLASQTSFTLTVGPADDDALNGAEMLCQDVGSTIQKCMGTVLDYTGSTKTVTLLADPAVFTMAATDYVAFYANPNAATLLNRLTQARANLLDNLGDLDAPVSATSTVTIGQIAAACAAALAVDTYAELAAAPAATASIATKLTWMFMLSRNLIYQTNTTQTLRNDALSATVATAPVTDDAVTFTRGEWS
jgi:hypothetical protein